MTEKDNSENIIDEDKFNASKTGGIKESAMTAFNQAVKARATEMNTGGERQIYYEGRIVKVFAPNNCQIFSNSVDALRIVLLPKLREHKDDKVIKELQESYEKEKKTFDEWIKNKKETIQEYSTNKKTMHLAIDTSQQATYEIDIRRVELATKLFEMLSYLMSICNYFDESYGGY